MMCFTKISASKTFFYTQNRRFRSPKKFLKKYLAQRNIRSHLFLNRCLAYGKLRGLKFDLKKHFNTCKVERSLEDPEKTGPQKLKKKSKEGKPKIILFKDSSSSDMTLEDGNPEDRAT